METCSLGEKKKEKGGKKKTCLPKRDAEWERQGMRKGNRTTEMGETGLGGEKNELKWVRAGKKNYGNSR